MINNKGKTIPIFVLTGFLGSGKTTILNQLLSSAALSDTAVLVNEFGETGLDHLLLDIIDEEVILLESGCVCCSVRDDFSYSLLTLYEKRKKEIVPSFRQVILETTGIADPIAIHQLVMSDQEIVKRYHYGGTITVVDSVYGQNTLDQHLEAMKQISVADQIIISKTDLSRKETVEQLGSRLRSINPTALLMHSGRESIDPKKLLKQMKDLATEDIDLKFNSEAYSLDTHGSGNISSIHDKRFSSFCIRWTKAVDQDDFIAWLEGLLVVRGDSIYRLKGLVNIKDQDRPVVIQGVQHSFYPPVTLDIWPQGLPKTELVFITRDFTKQAAINSLECILDVSAG